MTGSNNNNGWCSGANFADFEIGKLYKSVTSGVYLYDYMAPWPATSRIRLDLGDVILMVGWDEKSPSWPLFLFGEGKYTPFADARDSPSRYFRKVS